MNIHKNIFALTLLVVAFQAHAAGLPVADGSLHSDNALRLHLFDPIPQHYTNTRINKMFERAHEKMLAEGSSYESALMKEVRLFLHAEIAMAAKNLADMQGSVIDADQVAELLLQDKLEEPYRKAHAGAELFEANPFSLEPHAFTYYLYENLYPVFLAQPHTIPSGSRGGLELMAWISAIRVGFGWMETIGKVGTAGNKLLDDYGMSK